MIGRVVELSVRKKQFTLVVFATLTALGLESALSIPRAEDPAFPNPIFAAIAVYPGASPVEIEAQLIDPLEDALEELDDVKRIRASADDGLMVLRVDFDAKVDADAKYDDVLRQISAVRAALPSGVVAFGVKRYETTEVAIRQLALVSTTSSYEDLRALTKQIDARIGAVRGVKDVTIWGLPDRQLRVSLDMARLAQLAIPYTRVLQAIQAENASIPGGRVDAGARTMNVETSGRYTSLDEVRATIVGGAPGQLVRLSDVAQVAWAHADATHVTRANGVRAVFVSVRQKAGQNISVVSAAIEEALAEIPMPEGVSLVSGFHQVENVEHRLSGLERDFLLAIALVLVTLLPLGFRASVIVMISIPLSLACGLAMLWLTGYTLNQLSIVGFVIALGLLVDDSIVVTENITRFLRMGRSPVEAAIEGTQQIAVAVLGCTATLLFAFLPLLFLPGTAGLFIRSMPLAVVYTIAASLIVSITIIPLLASLMLRAHAEGEGRVLRAVNAAIEASYRPLLRAALEHPKLTAIASAAVFGASLLLVPQIGFSLFPKAGTPQFLVEVETPEGSSVEETDRAIRFVEGVLAKRPELRFVFSNAGHGNPTVYYNRSATETRPNRGDVFVEGPRRSVEEFDAFYDALRAELAEYPAARIRISEFENGPPVDAPIAIRVFGPELDELRRLSGEVAEILAKTPGTRDVRDPLRDDKTDLVVRADAEKAGLLGVPVFEIDRAVRMAIAGLEAGKFRSSDGEEYPIVLTVPRTGRASLDALDALFVFSTTGAAIPLRQVARVEWKRSPPQLQHLDGERVVTVTADVRTGFVTDRVTVAALAALEAKPLPSGYRWEAAGERESRQESFGGLGTAILVAVFGVLAVLVLEFGTFKSTLIVASVIPLGIVGGLLALYLTHNTLSFTAVIGFVALIGIEVKNSILLVDFTNQLRAQGTELDEAIRLAGETRFFPILLTTLTAVGGLLPLALAGSALYSPLAWVVIGGLLSSTVLSRLVTPVMYKLLTPPVD